MEIQETKRSLLSRLSTERKRINSNDHTLRYTNHRICQKNYPNNFETAWNYQKKIAKISKDSSIILAILIIFAFLKLKQGTLLIFFTKIFYTNLELIIITKFIFNLYISIFMTRLKYSNLKIKEKSLIEEKTKNFRNLSKKIITYYLYYFTAIYIPFTSSMSIIMRKAKTSAKFCVENKFSENSQICRFLKKKPERISKISGRTNISPGIPIEVIQIFFLTNWIFSLLISSITIPEFFSAKIKFRDILNNYDKKYEKIFNFFSILKILANLFLTKESDQESIDLVLSAEILILYLIRKPYTNLESRSYFLWYHLLELGISFINLSTTIFHLKENSLLIASLLILSFTWKISKNLTIEFTKINFLHQNLPLEKKLRGFGYYCEYLYRIFDFENELTETDKKFLLRGILTPEHKILHKEFKFEQSNSIIQNILESSNHHFRSNREVERMVELKFFFEGIFQKHYLDCRDINCYCSLIRSVDEFYLKRLKELERQRRIFENSKFDSDLRVFHMMKENNKKRMIIMANVMLKEANLDNFVLENISSSFLSDPFTNFRPLSLMVSRIYKGVSSKKRKQKFYEFFFLKQIKEKFSKMYHEDEGISDPMESGKVYSDWVHLDVLKIMRANFFIKKILRNTMKYARQIQDLFELLLGEIDFRMDEIHKKNLRIVKKKKEIKLGIISLEDDHKYKGSYAYPFIASYYMNSRGKFLQAVEILKKYKKLNLKKIELMSILDFGLDGLELVGHVFNVSSDLEEIGTVRYASPEAYQLFISPSSTKETSNSSLIGENINSFLPLFFQKIHFSKMKNLEKIQKVINKKSPSWVQRDDGFMTSVAFLLKLSPCFDKELSILVSLKEVQEKDTFTMVTDSFGEICGYSNNWAEGFHSKEIRLQNLQGKSWKPYLKNLSLSMISHDLYSRLFKEVGKLKDNIFILEKKKSTLLDQQRKNSKLYTTLDFAVGLLQSLFEGKNLSKKMKTKMKKLIYFDKSRGFVVPGILGDVIQIPERTFKFTFLPRDSKTKKYSAEQNDSKNPVVISKYPTFMMTFKVSYKKENYFGKVFYFLELKLISKEELTNRHPKNMLFNQLNTKYNFTCSGSLEQLGLKSSFGTDDLHDEKNFEVNFFKAFWINRSNSVFHNIVENFSQANLTEFNLEPRTPREQVKTKLYSTFLNFVDNTLKQTPRYSQDSDHPNYKKLQMEKNLILTINQILAFEDNMLTTFLKSKSKESHPEHPILSLDNILTNSDFQPMKKKILKNNPKESEKNTQKKEQETDKPGGSNRGINSLFVNPRNEEKKKTRFEYYLKNPEFERELSLSFKRDGIKRRKSNLKSIKETEEKSNNKKKNWFKIAEGLEFEPKKKSMDNFTFSNFGDKSIGNEKTTFNKTEKSEIIKTENSLKYNEKNLNWSKSKKNILLPKQFEESSEIFDDEERNNNKKLEVDDEEKIETLKPLKSRKSLFYSVSKPTLSLKKQKSKISKISKNSEFGDQSVSFNYSNFEIEPKFQDTPSPLHSKSSLPQIRINHLEPQNSNQFEVQANNEPPNFIRSPSNRRTILEVEKIKNKQNNQNLKGKSILKKGKKKNLGLFKFETENSVESHFGEIKDIFGEEITKQQIHQKLNYNEESNGQQDEFENQYYSFQDGNLRTEFVKKLCLKENLKYFKIWDNALKNRKKKIINTPKFGFLIPVIIMIFAGLANQLEETQKIKEISYLKNMILEGAVLKSSISDVFSKILLSQAVYQKKAQSDWFEPDFINIDGYGNSKQFREEIFYKSFFNKIKKIFSTLSLITMDEMKFNDPNVIGEFKNEGNRILENIDFEFQRNEDYILNSLVIINKRTISCYNRLENYSKQGYICDYEDILNLIEQNNLKFIIQRISDLDYKINEFKHMRNEMNIAKVIFLKSLVFIVFCLGLLTFIVKFFFTVKFASDIYSTYSKLTSHELNFMLKMNKKHLNSLKRFKDYSEHLQDLTEIQVRKYSVKDIAIKFRRKKVGFLASENLNLVNKLKSKNYSRKFCLDKEKILIWVFLIFVISAIFFVFVNLKALRRYENLIQKMKVYEGLYVVLGDASLLRFFNVLTLFGNQEVTEKKFNVGFYSDKFIQRIYKAIKDIEEIIYDELNEVEEEKKFVFDDFCESKEFGYEFSKKFDCENYLGGVLTKGMLYFIHQNFNMLKDTYFEIKTREKISDILKKNIFGEVLVFSEFLSGYISKNKEKLKMKMDDLIKENYSEYFVWKIFSFFFFFASIVFVSLSPAQELYREFFKVFHVFRIIFPVIYEGNKSVGRQALKYYDMGY